MKSLSDDITLTLDTTNFPEGYVTTTIYYNSIGVFMGRTYIDAQHTPVDICLNDFIIQNHGRNDYLKLNNNGELVSNGLNPSAEHISKFELGQVGQYTATIYNGQYSSYASVYAVAGYNYPNKDMEPTILKDDSSSDIGRVMQGSDWYVKHEDERGDFNDLLVPHLPAIPTKKFGMGLQIINAGQIDYPFAIRPPFGDDVSIGYAEGPSDATFITLYDIYQNTTINDAEDTSLFLKYQGTSGDEFGDMQEGREWFRGRVNINGIRIQGIKDGEIVSDNTYEEGETFRVYLTRYINTAQVDWDITKIMSGDRELLNTEWNSQPSIVSEAIEVFEDNYSTIEIPRSATPEFYYDRLLATPIYEDFIDTINEPDEYIGKCTVAVLDSCYSRYYLAWMDRYGDVQSQAFDGKIEYTEDTQKTEIKDYKMRRRVIHNELQPKWKLNTKWLNEDVYPMYEAIFTSPYLLLYDTQTDRSWNVILTDNKYTEKTYKNQKALFNLEITIEANTKENRIF